MLNSVVLSVLLLTLAGCGAKGHVHVRDAELMGTYVTDFHPGKEQLVLRSDKTYEQVFSSATRQFTHHGRWESTYVFLEGTDIELLNADCSEDDPRAIGPCERNLNVHRDGGKLKLALNEAADWYYERIN